MGVFLPQKQDKEVISIRIPSNVLKTVDEKASEVDISLLFYALYGTIPARSREISRMATSAVGTSVL